MRCLFYYNVRAVTEEDEAHTFKHKLQPAEKRKLKGSTMSLIVTLLVVTLVTQCWSAPQRRNWTPQAILYLKGAQGHRSVLERATREEEDALHLVTRSDGFSLSAVLLELLQRAEEEDGDNPDYYSEKGELNLNFL